MTSGEKKATNKTLGATIQKTDKLIKFNIESALQGELIKLGVDKPKILVERPADLGHGDYASNVALIYAKQLKKAPLEVALLIVTSINQAVGTIIKGVDMAEVAGPGFINFYLSKETSQQILNESYEAGEDFGRTDVFADKKNLYEYTDPNPMKIFHIGHVMANTIGESLSRLGEFGGAEVKRFCYQGDVGRHIALTMWGLRFFDGKKPADDASVRDKVKYWGDLYACGATKFYALEKESKELGEGKVSPEFAKALEEVTNINKKIYDKSDEELNVLYEDGREVSLEYFELLYDILGTKFDQYFFESQCAKPGIAVVKDHPEIFEESEGAVVFKGEKYGLHTRVFITKDKLPTYEGKEIGLAKLKHKAFDYDNGFTITANEQNGYFSVVNKAIELVYPDLSGKLIHLSHGMMKLTSGKMSSRKGDVIAGEELINDIKETAFTKMDEAGRKFEEKEKNEIAEQVAVAAIKFTILKQALGKDIIFDKEKSLSVEGDSGPYIQYTAVRANSILEKGKTLGFKPTNVVLDDSQGEIVEQNDAKDGTKDSGSGEHTVFPVAQRLQKLLMQFPETVARAQRENAPHHVATYLIEAASLFNSYYNGTQIVVEGDTASQNRLALVQLFGHVMKNGLWLLGIKVPPKM